MKQLTQTILADDPSGRLGNCFQAAVACLLELDFDQVPHICEATDWVGYLIYWAATQGWTVHRRNTLEGVTHGVATGPSPRGYSHAVVVIDGQIAWDPHPSRDGILRVQEVWEFVPADPADTRHQQLLDMADQYMAEILAEPPVRRTARPTPTAREGGS